MKPKRFDLYILLALTGLSVFMRFFSFFPSVISHDESTYLEIAREIFRGKIYFVDLVDPKPIGIFLIIGLIIKFISHSIFVIRLITAIVVALTAFVIYKIGLYTWGERKSAVASGVIYVFLVSVYTFYGIFINPELYYVLFTAIGFYSFIRWRNVFGFFLCGLSLGIGFILKYVVLFDLAAFLIYFSLIPLIKKEFPGFFRSIGLSFIAVLGFLLPFAIVMFYYYAIGHLHEFFYYTFEVSSRYHVHRSFIQSIVFVGDFYLRFLPVTFFFVFALIKYKNKNVTLPVTKGFILLWCFMVLIIILMPGKSFGQYFIQMMVPFSIYAGLFFSNSVPKPKWMLRITGYPVGTAILSAFLIFNFFMEKHEYFDKPDIPREVADYLKPRLHQGDTLFTGNYQQVIYYLVGTDSPVKYVHRTLLCAEHHRQLLQINLKKEMDRLMAKNLKYIIMNGPYCYEPMNKYIAANYNLIHVFDKTICLYERKKQAVSQRN